VILAGDWYEAKKLRNGTIWFSPAQYQRLATWVGTVTILVFNGGPEPVVTFPFAEIQDGYYKNIRVAGVAREPELLLPTQDKDLKARLIQMANNATKVWEWTDSKRIADEREDIFMTEVLKEISRRGYHRD
jgi:hypothetical protein